MDLQALLDDIARESAPFAARGKVADYIPALAAVDPSRFGLAPATVEGQVLGSGDWRLPFSIQSVSKAFSLALVLARDGEALWKRVGWEPSGNPFNSLVQLEHLRRRRGLRLPRGLARQERRGRRQPGGVAGARHPLRVEPCLGCPRQQRGGH